MAKVCETVFSCAVKGCLPQPFLMSHRQVGLRNTKEIRPATTTTSKQDAARDSAYAQLQRSMTWHLTASGALSAQPSVHMQRSTAQQDGRSRLAD